MNAKLALLSVASFLGLAAVSFAQPISIGNPFASLGIDFYGFFLPWIFTFAIVFGLLSKVEIFKKNINAALAFVIAFFVSAVGGPQLALFFTTLFGGASMFLAGILVIILFLALIGQGEKIKEKKTGYIALAVVVLIGIALFLASSGNFIAVQFMSTDLAGMLFWIVIIVVAIWFVMDSGEGKSEGGKPG